MTSFAGIGVAVTGQRAASIVHAIQVAVVNDGDIPADLAFPWLIELQRDARRLWMLELQRNTVQLLNEQMIDKQFTTSTKGNRFIGGERGNDPGHQADRHGSGKPAASEHGSVSLTGGLPGPGGGCF